MPKSGHFSAIQDLENANQCHTHTDCGEKEISISLEVFPPLYPPRNVSIACCLRKAGCRMLHCRAKRWHTNRCRRSWSHDSNTSPCMKLHKHFSWHLWQRPKYLLNNNKQTYTHFLYCGKLPARPNDKKVPLYFSSSTKSNRKVCLDILIFVSFNKGHVLRLRPIRGLKKKHTSPFISSEKLCKGWWAPGVGTWKYI